MQSFKLIGLRTYCEDGTIYSYGDILQPDRIYEDYADDKNRDDNNQENQSDKQ